VSNYILALVDGEKPLSVVVATVYGLPEVGSEAMPELASTGKARVSIEGKSIGKPGSRKTVSSRLAYLEKEMGE
jgi:hypothetical protein